MMSEARINKYLSLARHACYYSDNKRARVGCVLIYHGKVLSVGWNLEDKEHPMQKQMNALRGFDPNASGQRSTLHAEMSACLKVRHYDIDWNKVSMFVYRIKKDGTRALSRPCQACAGYAKELGIRNIYYSTDDGYGYERRTE